MRPAALPEFPEPQAALPRPTPSSGPALSLLRLGDEAPLRRSSTRNTLCCTGSSKASGR